MRRILLVLALATAARAQTTDDVINADRPGLADSSVTVGRGVFQVETGLERDDDAFEHALSTPTLLRYGLSDTFELRVESAGYESDGESGWATPTLGFKKRFRQHPSLGLIGRIGQHATGDLRLAADLDLNDKWSMNPNVGVAFEEDFTAALAALTVQYNVSDTLNVFVDGALQSPEEEGGTSSVLVDTGVAWILGRHTQLDFSAGWGTHGATAPDVFWSVGISRAF